MTKRLILATLTVLAVAVLWLAVSTALAQSGEYALDWWTVDGGGHTFTSGEGYSLGGTVGQPDAAMWTDGEYTLAGGFWGGFAAQYNVYLPLVLRGY